jgi:hypothetical protein
MARQTRAGLLEVSSPGYDIKGSPFVVVEVRIDASGTSQLIQVIGPFQSADTANDYFFGKGKFRDSSPLEEGHKPVLVNDRAYYLMPLYHPIP